MSQRWAGNQIVVENMAVMHIRVIQVLVMGNHWEFRAEERPAMIYILEGIALTC